MTTQSAEWITAARVLRRSGFGAAGPEIDSALRLGSTRSYIEVLLNADFANDPGVLATPMPDLDAPTKPKAGSSRRRGYFAKLEEQRKDLTHWWIRRMTAVVNPVNEKLTFLWHNHFATSMSKVTVAARMAKQNQALRDLCLGDFRTLALAMLTDAALVDWLDAQKNEVGSPNENLAREFLELFALGHGNGYTEEDVREGARALTGWRIQNNLHTVLDAKRYDTADKTILGTTGKLGLEEFCDVVLAHPNSTPFVAGKLWRQIASDQAASSATLERLVTAYGPNRNLKALTLAILNDPDFLENSATVVTSPVDWLIGLIRAVRAPMDDSERVQSTVKTLTALGQLPFYPTDVSGWPYGQAWLSSTAANIRMRVANDIAKGGDVTPVAEAAVTDRIDAAGYLIGVGAWSERSAEALKPLRKNPPALVAAAVNTPEYLTS